ncbi:MAG TPA: ABC transporter permease [Chitinophagaceae bacterium]|jgi:predicted permease|nr:ABC transporter permease [Chitinophagaceae bacterium]
MFKNYFKTAFRNLKRNKSYALINVLGLTVGIAASLLIFLVIQYETSFDNFHKKKNGIYRLGTQFHTQDGVSYSDGVSFPVAAALRIDFPQIKEVASIFRNGSQVTIEQGDRQLKKLNEDNFYYAEPQFFKMFDFEWLAGTPETSLKDPHSAALTQATAEKYYGDWKSAIGKTFKYGNKTVYKVTGILKNVPANTDFPLSAVVGYSALENTYIKNNLNDWVSTYGGAYTFVVLPPGLSPVKFDAQLKAFAKKHKPAEYSQDTYVTQPLSEIHFDDRFGNFRGHTFSHSLIKALAFIGLFLILIACVNFINLATAQAVNRSREVGVRKVLGSNRRQLAFQFLGETAFITVAAAILAVVAAEITLPLLNRLLETKMTMGLIFNTWLLLFILIITISVTVLSGLYPAIILSGFNPITALKSKITSKMVGGISMRRVLVVLQFAIAQILIIGMLIVVSQMNFFRNASLGFDKAAIINVPFPSDSFFSSHSSLDYLRNQFLSNKDISNVSFSFASPSSDGNWNSDFKFDHAAKTTNFSANLKWADPDYFKTFNIKFVAGRPFYQSDTVKEFVVNETLLRKLGIRDPQEAIGKEINFWDGNKVGNIVGVIRDFNSYSLRQPMAPVVLSTWKEVYQTINIKIKPGSEKSVLRFVDKLWNQTFPDYFYQYQFLDETIASFYKQENQLSILYKIFAAIAILISCLGLYGLVSFMAVQRTKEVGIRKVLGASVRHIVYLMSKEFTLLIVLAFIISAPVGYYIMHKWLQNYTYRIPLSASIFLLAIAGSILIAWITAGQRAIKSALANPVRSLRTE